MPQPTMGNGAIDFKKQHVEVMGDATRRPLSVTLQRCPWREVTVGPIPLRPKS